MLCADSGRSKPARTDPAANCFRVAFCTAGGFGHRQHCRYILQQLAWRRTATPSSLHVDSVIFCEEITTIDHDFLARGPVGTLSPKLMDAVNRAVRRAIGEVVAEP
ncbi:MAG: type II toxin-antitoxin system PemK/MazF family toxin [Candidatus Dormibacteraceae bacterium]